MYIQRTPANSCNILETTVLNVLHPNSNNKLNMRLGISQWQLLASSTEYVFVLCVWHDSCYGLRCIANIASNVTLDADHSDRHRQKYLPKAIVSCLILVTDRSERSRP